MVSKEQNKLAYETLIKKLNIVISGANKRSNKEVLKNIHKNLDLGYLDLIVLNMIKNNN